MSPVKSPEELGAPDAGKKDKIVVEKDEAEELLPGWTKEVKVRKTGSATKVDRYYTDPVTGYIFRSLRDVQRYLKTGELGRLAIKPKVEKREEAGELKEQMSESLRQKRAPMDKSELPARPSKRLAGVNADAPAPAPPLSPLQPKTRHATRLAGIKVDVPSPSQPVTEPKTRQATQLAGMVVDSPPPPSSSAEPKTRQATRLAEVAVDSSPSDTKTDRHATRQSGIKADASVPSPQPAAPKTRQAARQAGIQIDSPPPLPPDSKTRQATPLTATETGPSPPSQPEPKTRQAKPVSGIQDNASPTSPPLPKTRRATRQAGIKINSPPPSPPDTRNSRQATRTRLVNSATSKENNKKTEAEKITNHHNENAMDFNPNHNQESNPVTPKEHLNKIETGSTTSPLPQDQAPPTVAVPPLNPEKQESPVVNPTISNPIPPDSYSYGTDTKPDSSINFSMNDLWTDPCIEFAVKTLTGAIPVTDLNKVENFTAPSEVPVQEFWNDPCIEFAVKTLTGAIPVGEDGYLLHRPASSSSPQGPHQFSSPDVFSKHYEAGLKNKQQDSVFPVVGNGGLQKSGKLVNGSNGQCSRSRFFQ
ncbi:hypothetical protein L1987_43071 [Smallanthus sonchifolius]|uniref:Uncharacterized protein n=1 Tax=Smallanthus sonchifolius TaxID=185202 RepID=A0ACB9GLS3_9ASTR|nr:hypothetical protein L1987_43071 [Smallanthus sonchifolius]